VQSNVVDLTTASTTKPNCNLTVTSWSRSSCHWIACSQPKLLQCSYLLGGYLDLSNTILKRFFLLSKPCSRIALAAFKYTLMLNRWLCRENSYWVLEIMTEIKWQVLLSSGHCTADMAKLYKGTGCHHSWLQVGWVSVQMIFLYSSCGHFDSSLNSEHTVHEEIKNMGN